jgi:hypothetical protein
MACSFTLWRGGLAFVDFDARIIRHGTKRAGKEINFDKPAVTKLLDELHVFRPGTAV